MMYQKQVQIRMMTSPQEVPAEGCRKMTHSQKRM